MTFRMPDSYYDPPEPQLCCEKAEDEEDHDWQGCLADQANDAAEDKAEQQREAQMDREYTDQDYFDNYR